MSILQPKPGFRVDIITESLSYLPTSSRPSEKKFTACVENHGFSMAERPSGYNLPSHRWRGFRPQGIKKLIFSVLRHERIRSASLTLIFVSDPFIKRLNKKYLNKSVSTDVLAFDLQTGFRRIKTLLGDIVVSLDAAERISKNLGVSFREEVWRYCIHGVLHLCGYDDSTKNAKKKMWEKQETYLKNHLSQVSRHKSQVELL